MATIKQRFATEGEQQLKQAFTQIRNESKQLKAEMGQLSAEFKGNKSSIEYLVSEEKNLASQQDLAAQKIKLLATQLKAAQSAYGENSEQAQKLNTQLTQAETEYTKITNRVNENKAALEKSEKAYAGVTTKTRELVTRKQELTKKIEEERKKLDEAADVLKKTENAEKSNTAEIQKAKAAYVEADKNLEKYEKELKNTDKELNDVEKNLKDAKNSQQDFNTQLEKSEGAARRANDGYTVLKNTLANLATDVLRKSFQEFKQLAVAVVETGVNFDTAMSQIAATSGWTAEELVEGSGTIANEFEMLKEKAKELGENTKFTATEAAEGLNILKMAGLDTEEAIAGIDTVLDLASAGTLDMESSAKYVTGAVFAWGDSMDHANKYADLMAKGATLAKTDVNGLGEALSSVGATANAYGQDAETTTLSLLRLAQANITGSEAATYLRTAMTKLYAPTDSAKKVLDGLNVSAYDAAGNARNFNDVIADLDNAMQGLTEEQQNSYTETIFGIRGLSAYNDLVMTNTESVGKWGDALKHASDGMGSASEQAKTQLDNLGGDWTIFQSQLEGIKLDLYDGIQPILRDVIKDVSNFLKTVDWKQAGKDIGGVLQKTVDVLEWILQHGGVVKATVTGIVAAFAINKTSKLVGSVKDLGSGFAKLVPNLKNATTAQQGMNAAAAANPYVLLAAAIAAVVAATASYIAKAMEAARETNKYTEEVDRLRDVNDDLADSIKTTEETFQDSVQTTEVEARQAERLTEKLNDLMGVENKSATQKAEIKAIVEDLNQLVPDLALAYDEETDSLNLSTDAILKNIDARKKQARLEAVNEYATSSSKNVVEAEMQVEQFEELIPQMEADLEYWRKLMQESAMSGDMSSYYKYQFEYNMTAQNLAISKNELTEATKNLTKAQQDENVAYQQLHQALAIEELDAFVKFYEEKFGVALPESFQTMVESAYEMGIRVPESIVEGLKSGDISMEEAMDELNRIVDLQKAIDEATAAGIQVPQEFIDGVNDGSMSVTDAIDTLNSLVKYDKSERASRIGGEQTAEEYADGIEAKAYLAQISANDAARGAINALMNSNHYFWNAGAANAASYESGWKYRLDQHSPSRKMYNNAKMVVQGALNAFNAEQNSLYKAGMDTAESYEDGFHSIMDAQDSFNSMSGSLAKAANGTIQHMHTGTIHVEGVNSAGELTGVVDIIVDQLRREVRA